MRFALSIDCSQPSGDAVNDYADIESFKYQSLEDALKLLKPGYYMAKVDLHHAYRSMAIHPKNFHATGWFKVEVFWRQAVHIPH